MAELKYYSEDGLLLINREFTGLTVILGANGAGKSTMLEIWHGMRARDRVFWDEIDACDSRSSRGFVAQKPILISGRVEKNFYYAAKLLGLSKSQTEARMKALFDEFDLGQFLTRPNYQLSGGEIARMAMARALLADPKILLLDEVSAHLDPANTEIFERHLTQFSQHNGNCAFLVTHDLAQAKRLADQVIYLADEKIAFVGLAKVFWKKHTSFDALGFSEGL